MKTKILNIIKIVLLLAFLIAGGAITGGMETEQLDAMQRPMASK